MLMLAALSGRADTITNYVWVISNIYNRVYTESVVTQKVKSTHTDYYFTNYVTMVTNVYTASYRTNVSVNVDVSDKYVLAASNQANRASAMVDDARGFADRAAVNASAALSSSSAAWSYANQARSQRESAARECDLALSNINARINWFDLHAGETITQYTWTTNIYFAVDTTARYWATNALDKAVTNENDILLLKDMRRDDLFAISNLVLNAERGVANNHGQITSLVAKVNGFAKRLDELESRTNDLCRVYVSPDGTIYSNIVYYTESTANGKVAVTTVGNYYAASRYCFWPAFSEASSSSYWTMVPAYVDSDAYGMRLHYLPTSSKAFKAKTVNTGLTYIPRDFFWQNGTLYGVVDGYNGTNWSGRIRMKYKGERESAYPCTIGQKTMSMDRKDGTIMSITSDFYGYVRSLSSDNLPTYDSVLWIPETCSADQKVIVDWLSTFKY